MCAKVKAIPTVMFIIARSSNWSTTRRVSRSIELQMQRAAASTTNSNSSSTGALGRMQLRLRSQRTTAAANATITPRVPAIKDERSPVSTRSSLRIKRQLHTSPTAQDLAVASSSPVSTPQPRKRTTRAKAPTPLAYEANEHDSADVSVKSEDASAVELVSSESASPAVRKKAKRSSKTDASRVKRTAPARWKEMLEGIQTMRAGGGAEVDSMGCEVRLLALACVSTG